MFWSRNYLFLQIDHVWQLNKVKNYLSNMKRYFKAVETIITKTITNRKKKRKCFRTWPTSNVTEEKDQGETFESNPARTHTVPKILPTNQIELNWIHWTFTKTKFSATARRRPPVAIGVGGWIGGPKLSANFQLAFRQLSTNFQLTFTIWIGVYLRRNRFGYNKGVTNVNFLL